MKEVDTWANCATCGESVPVEAVGTPRIPCPICGSLARRFGAHIRNHLAISGRLTGVVTRDDKPIGFVESGTPEMTRHTAYLEDGTIVLNLQGLTPSNEDDTQEVCQIFATALNGSGVEASVLGQGTLDEDYRILLEGSEVGVQIVRALTDGKFWTRLRKQGEVKNLPLTVDKCEESLWTAITLKEEKIPRPQRPKLILLLDAYRIPAFAIGCVIDQFKRNKAAAVKQLGFHSVYVAGPTSLFVSRLDEGR
jgi:hypothetical protein